MYYKRFLWRKYSEWATTNKNPLIVINNIVANPKKIAFRIKIFSGSSAPASVAQQVYHCTQGQPWLVNAIAR